MVWRVSSDKVQHPTQWIHAHDKMCIGRLISRELDCKIIEHADVLSLSMSEELVQSNIVRHHRHQGSARDRHNA